MTMFIIQSAILIAIAVFLGWAVGTLARRLFSGSPNTVPTTPQPATNTDQKDNLQKIQGVGAVLEKKLHTIGITSFAQIADWTQEDMDTFSKQLDFSGRIEREKWVEQAKMLMKNGA